MNTERLGRQPKAQSALALTLLVLMANPSLGANLTTAPVSRPEITAEVVAGSARPDVVTVLHYLDEIEAEVMLGMLFLDEDMTHPEGSHFVRLKDELYPGLKDAITKAGIADLGPQIDALAAATEKTAVSEANLALHLVMEKARQQLEPTDRELELAAIESVQQAFDLTKDGGANDVHKYQDAWAAVSMARDHLYVLLESPDPEVKNEAQTMVTTIDDLFIAMPDPVAGADGFDPAAIGHALEVIKADAHAT